MSMGVEDIARLEAELMERPNIVRVEVPVSWNDGVCLPVEKSEIVELAYFNTMTFGDNFIIEKASRYEEEVDGHPKTSTDYNEMRRLSLKRCLTEWTLGVPIEREHGWITKACYEHVGKLPAPLIEAFLDGFWSSIGISEEEEETISKQSGALFSRNSRGVSDACEAVRLYCTLSSFSEKFNLSKEQIMSMPYREYLMLKMMVGHENESMRREQKRREPPATKIAGPGGRVRESRGTRVAL